MPPALTFTRVLTDQEPGPGELLLHVGPERRELACQVLEGGLAGLRRGAGPVTSIVLPLDPTLDDLLAAELALAELAGDSPPAGLALFARYAAVARSGLRPGSAPLERSLEGYYLAVRCEAGPLDSPRRAASFVAGWRRLWRIVRDAASAGLDPFERPLEDPRRELAREAVLLAHDQEVFSQDCARGARWRLAVPGWPPDATGLVLRTPRSLLFKHWARAAGGAGPAATFLAVHFEPGQWVFSTDPIQRLQLVELATRLQAAEREKDPERAARDPWFDGAPFQHTLVAAPRGASALEDESIEELARDVLCATPLLPRPAPSPSVAETIAPASPGTLPAVVGDFELLSKLGEGGMGEVFLARQRPFGREVALKVIASRYLGDAQAIDRFAREVQVLAALQHPNVLTIHAAGAVAGRPWFAMELVRGGDAEQLVETSGGRLPERRALEIVRDCARGLLALERAGLVHRDIKPSNIFIAADGTAKLADLGLVYSPAEAARLTGTGLIVGTPLFMSPEQAHAVEVLDARSDIYSLGATLFFLLCGKPPFEGASAWEVFRQLFDEPPAPPRSLVPTITRKTSKLVLHMLAKTPADRPASAAALLEALEPLVTA